MGVVVVPWAAQSLSLRAKEDGEEKGRVVVYSWLVMYPCEFLKLFLAGQMEIKRWCRLHPKPMHKTDWSAPPPPPGSETVTVAGTLLSPT